MRAVSLSAAAIVLLWSTPSLGAQGTPRRAGQARTTSSIRAEYAGVLLQSRRYDEAITEYRRLLTADPERFEYRLGLARALAWSKRNAEAERELLWLLTRAPRDADLEQMLRSVRAGIDPSSSQAHRWVAERPAFVPYRIALARAYAREGRARQAAAQFDTVLRAGPYPELLREAAAAHGGARQYRTAVTLLQRALARAPADTGLRHEYARSLWMARDRDAALAQYDSLLLLAPSPAWLVERARLRVASRDLAGAERDLASAIALRPTAEAYLVRGDLHRWRGELGAARRAYESGLTLEPARGVERDLRSRVLLLERESRPSLGAVPEGDLPGWVGRLEVAADNAGFEYAKGGGRYGLPLSRVVAASFGVEQRRVVERAASSRREAYGIGGDAGASASLPFGRLSVRGGVMRQGGAGSVTFGSAGAVAWWRAWRASAELRRELAYPILMSARTLGVDALGGHGLLATRSVFGASGSVGLVDIGVVADLMRLSDGNVRPAWSTTVRYSVAPSLSALYVAQDLRFRQQTALYWTPGHYSAHSLGLETSVRRDRGLSLAARGLAGMARTVERGDTTGAISTRYALYGAAEGEAVLRTSWAEGVLGLSYGRGRAGGYQRWGATLGLRLLP